MDAAELQELRDRRDFLSSNEVLALLDALEQAQKELRATNHGEAIHQARVAMALAQDERDQAQKDAKDARALLGLATERLAATSDHVRDHRLHARIEAMLEQKP